MATESEFYLKQAESCARQAEASLLPNQRGLHLRAQAAWQALADRRLLTETQRAQIDAEKRQAPEPEMTGALAQSADG
jgi:hypothetical protein